MASPAPIETRHALATKVLKASEELTHYKQLRARADALGLSIFGRHVNLDIEVTPDTLEKAQEAIKAAKHAEKLFGLEVVTAYMRSFEVSKIFKVSRQKEKFTEQLIGRKVMIKGKETILTRELINFLTIDLTIGTPPVTRKFLRQFRSVVLGNADPSEIMELARVVGLDYYNSGRLVQRVSDLVDMSTHYLEAGEERAHLADAPDTFLNSGPFEKVIISGGPKQAEKLLTKYLYEDRKGEIEIKDSPQFNGNLLAEMNANPSTIFIFHVSTIPGHLINDERWARHMGRVIFVDNSRESLRTGTTYVYTFFGKVAKSISSLQTRLGGKPSSPQLAVRKIIEDFEPKDIEENYKKFNAKLEKLEGELKNIDYHGNQGETAADDERVQTMVSDYISLRQFVETLKVIREIQGYQNQANGRENDLKSFGEELLSKTEKKWAGYMYRGLVKAGYVPMIGNGGGRGGLHTVALFLKEELKGTAETIKRKYPNLAVASTSPEEIESHIETSRSPSDIRRAVTSKLSGLMEGRSRLGLVGSVLGRNAQRIFDRLREGTAWPLILRARDELGLGIAGTAAAEREPAKFLENLVKQIEEFFNPTDEDNPQTKVEKSLDRLTSAGRAAKLGLAKKIYETVWKIINDVPADHKLAQDIYGEIIQRGNLDGRLILEEHSWSYSDVFDNKKDYPESSIIHAELKRDENGRIKVKELREFLYTLKARLAPWPEIMEGVMKSFCFVINSPRNPQSINYQERDILAVCDLAADFGITVVDDSSYYKLNRSVAKPGGKKDETFRPHYRTAAELVEDNKELFLNRNKPRIITVAAPTKNLGIAGGRLKLTLTRDHKLLDFERQQSADEAPNLMAAHLVKQEVEHGQAAKNFYNELLKVTARPKPIEKYLEFFETELSPQKVLHSGISYEGYKAIMDTYYLLIKIAGRNGTHKHAEIVIERLRKQLKAMRPEKAVAMDIDKRFDAAIKAIDELNGAADVSLNYAVNKEEGKTVFELSLPISHFHGSEVVSQALDKLKDKGVEVKNDRLVCCFEVRDDELNEGGADKLKEIQVSDKLAEKVHEKSIRAIALISEAVGYDQEKLRPTLDNLIKRFKIERMEARAANDSFLERMQINNKLDVEIEYREPQGAFYLNVSLPGLSARKMSEDAKQRFLEVVCARAGVGAVNIGDGYLRCSLGAYLEGNDKSYDILKQKVKIAAGVIYGYWVEYNSIEGGDYVYADPDELDAVLAQKLKSIDKDGFSPYLQAIVENRGDLLSAAQGGKRNLAIAGRANPHNRTGLAEEDIIFKIQNESQAVNVILRLKQNPPESPVEFMEMPEFRAMYNFLLRNYYRLIPTLAAKDEKDVFAQYSFERFKEAFEPSEQTYDARRQGAGEVNKEGTDNTLTDHELEVFAEIAALLELKWYSADVRTNVMMVMSGEDGLNSGNLRAASEIIGRHFRTIFMKVRKNANVTTKADPTQDRHHGFSSGYEVHRGIKFSDNLPAHIKDTLDNIDVVGEDVSTRDQTLANTENTKRLAGRAYSFEERSEREAQSIKATFGSDEFRNEIKNGEYAAIAFRAGITKQVVIIHKSYMHLVRDLVRLFPRLAEVTEVKNLSGADFDAATYFGIPKKFLGEHQMTGFYKDEDDTYVGWVNRDNTTDYIGYLKKLILTLHNKTVLDKGGLPFHGAICFYYYEDGTVEVVVKEGGSAVGKSEGLAAAREILSRYKGRGGYKKLVDIRIATDDMGALFLDKDGNIVVNGAETGSFSRMDQLTGTLFERDYAHLIALGARSNPGKTNERITIPHICATHHTLALHKVDVILSMDNFQIPKGSSVNITSVSDALDHVVEGARVNQGTAGDIMDFDRAVEYCRDSRIRKLREGKKGSRKTSFSGPLTFEETSLPNGTKTLCCSYRDGGKHDTETALARVKQMFLGQKVYYQKKEYFGPEEKFPRGSKWNCLDEVSDVEYDLVNNVYYLIGSKDDQKVKILLTIDVAAPVIKTTGNAVNEKTDSKDQWLEDKMVEDGGPLYQRVVRNLFTNEFGPNSLKNIELTRKRMEQFKAAAQKLESEGRLRGGIAHTQLAVLKMGQAGPTRFAEDLIALLSDPEFRTEEQQQRRTLIEAKLHRKLENTFRKGSQIEAVLPAVTAQNLRRFTVDMGQSIRLQESGISIPGFYEPDKIKEPGEGKTYAEQAMDDFKADLVPGSIRNSLERIIQTPDRTRERIHVMSDVDAAKNHYRTLVTDSIDIIELTYRILLHQGWINQTATAAQLSGSDMYKKVKIAVQISKELMGVGTQM